MIRTRPALRSAPLALAVLLLGCPGDLSNKDFSSSSGGDMAVGSAGGPCYSGGVCNSGLTCTNGVCVASSGAEWNPPQSDGTTPQSETAPPKPDQKPPIPDLPPPKPDQKITATGTFGDPCSATKICTAKYLCVFLGAGTTKGFCTKSCPTQSKACSGGAKGTVPYCILKDSKNKYYCVFLCKWQGGKASCPSKLTCSPTANPPGSGQHVCVP